MKITMLLGSPREQGNTATLVDRVRQKLETDSHEVEVVPLGKRDISPCLECYACQKVPDQPGCVQRDDMQEIYLKMLVSDAIFFACPVFCWSFPAQMKSVIDRTFSLFKFAEDGSYTSLLENKKSALIVTAGGDEFDGADLLVQTYERIARFSRMENLGHLVVADFTRPQILDAPHVQARIEGFCRKVG